jgi:Zn-dependent protease with chaperone function
MQTIHGKLYDGSSSAGQTTTLQLDDNDGLILIIGNKAISLSPRELEISSRLGNSARYIEISGYGRFETVDNDAIDRLANQFIPQDQTSFLHKLESNLPLIGLAIAITVVVVGAMIRWGIPALSDRIVEQLPDKTTDYIERVITDKIEQRWFTESKLSEQRQTQLQDLFLEVSHSLGVADKGYNFKLRDAQDTVGANALAFPAGSIVMTDQLVALAENDQQLSGVLAHEIGHLQGKHSLRQLLRGSILAILAAWITGDVSGASTVLIASPVALIELRYSREFESEADGYALRYIGCDASRLEEMARFFELLENHHHGDNKVVKNTSTPKPSAKDKKPEADPQIKPTFNLDFLQTHPSSKQRSDFFRQHFKSNCTPKSQ